MKLHEAIDTIFSHNELIKIWQAHKDHDSLLWSGTAHRIPFKYIEYDNWRIFGTITMNTTDASYINIRIWKDNEFTRDIADKI